MTTGQYFSFSRFRQLVALHWGSQKKLYLLALPAIGGLLIVWGVFLLLMDNNSPLDDGMQAFTYYWGLGLVGCVYSSTIFAEFGSKAYGIAWLGVPASALEKLLCGLLFSTVVVFVGFTLVFYLVDTPLVKIGNELIARQHRVWLGGYPIGPNPVWSLWGGLPGDNFDSHLHGLLVLYFILQALFALGSVYFERYAFVKTIIAFMVFLLLFLVLEKQVMAHIPPHGWNRYTLSNDWITNGDTLRVKEVRVSPWITGPLGLLVLLGIPPVIWVATYFRIKEKQV
ncbi:MAG TPA: hypothetical protein VGS79_04830 [Puia sp.]|nr:hypothetical protein [Puia sp.]